MNEIPDAGFVKEIASKIPYTVNPSFVRIIFDDINWMGETEYKPVIMQHSAASAINSYTYQSNCIEIVRAQFGYGKKHNILDKKIDFSEQVEKTGDINDEELVKIFRLY